MIASYCAIPTEVATGAFALHHEYSPDKPPRDVPVYLINEL